MFPDTKTNLGAWGAETNKPAINYFFPLWFLNAIILILLRQHGSSSYYKSVRKCRKKDKKIIYKISSCTNWYIYTLYYKGNKWCPRDRKETLGENFKSITSFQIKYRWKVPYQNSYYCQHLQPKWEEMEESREFPWALTSVVTVNFTNSWTKATTTPAHLSHPTPGWGRHLTAQVNPTLMFCVSVVLGSKRMWTMTLTCSYSLMSYIGS